MSIASVGRVALIMRCAACGRSEGTAESGTRSVAAEGWPACCGSPMDLYARAEPLPPPEGPEPIAPLSEREVHFVTMFARGYSNKSIAARMQVSVKTVETYKSRAMGKLKIRSRVDLVQYAMAQGWLSTPVVSDYPPRAGTSPRLRPGRKATAHV